MGHPLLLLRLSLLALLLLGAECSRARAAPLPPLDTAAGTAAAAAGTTTTAEDAAAANAMKVHTAALLAAQALALETQGGNATGLWLESAQLGNATAQFVVGVLHAWGLDGVKRDEVRAVLHLYFASLGGYIPAQMALGYRHLRGDGVPWSCRAAVTYYELAANQAVDEMLAGAGGVEPLYHAERLTAPDDGKIDPRTYSDVDIVDYYHNQASKGDAAAMAMLGRFYYFGARGVQRDPLRSFSFFSAAAAKNDFSAMTGLGYLLLQGAPGIEKNPAMAWSNFSHAAEQGHAAASNGLGCMLLYGYPGVVAQDVDKALKHISKAADAGVPEAFYNLGAMYVSSLKPETRDFVRAFRYFGLAAQKGSILAVHKLGHMSLHGLGTIRSCKNAVQYFKSVVERAYFAAHGADMFARAFASLHQVPLERTFQAYVRLAEMGYEVAESNAGRVLDEIYSKNYSDETRASFLGVLHTGLDVLGISHPPLGGSAEALRLYERAAEQGNQRARVRVGDFYYYGHGDVGEPDLAEAAAQYRLASEGRDAQANFNLGYQHHYGLGLAQDSHLAKRYYELAGEASPDARVPVALALGALWFEAAQRTFHRARGGPGAGGGVADETDDSLDHSLVSLPGSANGEEMDPALESWASWWLHAPSRFVSLLSSVDSIEIATDTVVIIVLALAFVAINKLREHRRHRLLLGSEQQQRQQQQQQQRQHN